MNNRELEELFEQFQFGVPVDTMCDAKQAEYDYDGQVPENEDPADWQKLKRTGAIKVG
jgi:hypothetical protein